jgi:hypothetical protein
MQRTALVVGIDYYQSDRIPDLKGCVNDAKRVGDLLRRNGDRNQTRNFDVVELFATRDPKQALTEQYVKQQIRKLFDGRLDTALFYFAGHGYSDITGGYLYCSDTEYGDDGIPLSSIITWANDSTADSRIIVLDSCHSGVAGARQGDSVTAEIKEGTTILTASTEEQYAGEKEGAGIFTTLFADALAGSAANLVGEVTPGSVYAHIDQSLGGWEQRPVFKTNVQSFVSLRRVEPPISLPELRMLKELFPEPGAEHALDPSYEPKRNPGEEDLAPPDPDNNRKFAILQKLAKVNLVVPVGADHMYFAAMGSKACRLTPLGEHYRRLASKDRL